MPSKYNVGNIEIGVISSNDNAIRNLELVIAKLKNFGQIDKNIQKTFSSVTKLANGLTKINKLDISLLDSKISDVSKNTKKFSSMLSNIKIGSFSETATSLNKVANGLTKINNFKDIDFDKLSSSFNKLNDIITPFLAKLNESKEALQAMSTILQKINIQDRKNKKKDKNKSTFNLSNLFNLGKIYFLFNYSKRIVQQIAKFLIYASDYVEILNKFKVSFQDLYQENLKNVNQLSRAFGFSTNTLLDYTATFNNMLKGLKGLSDETSATISQSLTRMAIDYASIFNVSIDRAMNAFQSAISGNIRTLRSISGFDVSETTIFSIYQQLGGTKTMRQLNQLEKRLLRIIAIQRQMEETGAMGDYGRTINCGFNGKPLNELFVNTYQSGVINNYVYC